MTFHFFKPKIDTRQLYSENISQAGVLMHHKVTHCFLIFGYDDASLSLENYYDILIPEIVGYKRNVHFFLAD